MVAAATWVRARSLEVQLERGKVLYRLEMTEPDLSSQSSLLTQPGQGSEARWLILAMAAQGQPTSLLCPAQGRKLSLGSGACVVSPWKSTDSDARLTLQVSQPAGIPPGDGHPAPSLLPLSGAASVGRGTSAKDLTDAHRGSPMAWSESVSGLFLSRPVRSIGYPSGPLCGRQQSRQAHLGGGGGRSFLPLSTSQGPGPGGGGLVGPVADRPEPGKRD